jgi:hypothetical protein
VPATAAGNHRDVARQPIRIRDRFVRGRLQLVERVERGEVDAAIVVDAGDATGALDLGPMTPLGATIDTRLWLLVAAAQRPLAGALLAALRSAMALDGPREAAA